MLAFQRTHQHNQEVLRMKVLQAGACQHPRNISHLKSPVSANSLVAINISFNEHIICIWLVVSTCFNPSEKYKSQLGWLFPIYGQIKFMFQTTNQYIYIISLSLSSSSYLRMNSKKLGFLMVSMENSPFKKMDDWGYHCYPQRASSGWSQQLSWRWRCDQNVWCWGDGQKGKWFKKILIDLVGGLEHVLFSIYWE